LYKLLAIIQAINISMHSFVYSKYMLICTQMHIQAFYMCTTAHVHLCTNVHAYRWPAYLHLSPLKVATCAAFGTKSVGLPVG